MLPFKKEIAARLASLTGMAAEEVETCLEIPPDPALGEYAFPCYPLARRLKKSPQAIAAELAGRMAPSEHLERVENAGPYLNFYVQRSYLFQKLLPQILQEGPSYGTLNEGEGRTVLVDYSAPNIAKPFSVGHLRSTVIGNALCRLYRACGYKVVGINHLGDWGTQFGKLIVAYRRWGEAARLAGDPVHYLYHLYVRFHQEAENEPELEEEARQWFRRLEKGDREARELWERFRDLSLENFQRLYHYLGISFDSYMGESDYNDRLEATIELARRRGLIKESEGALVADLEPYGLPLCLLRKKDGAALYITRDLAAAIYRHETYSFDRMLYVVGAEQTLHFQQFFKMLALLGFDWAGNCVHVPFGLIHFKDGRMSTRQGNVIFLEEVLKRAVELAREIIEEKNPSLQEKDHVARAVGLGAVIFGDLINDRIKDVEFDWEKVLDFAGETAPYIQYSHARICSILRRAASETGSSGTTAATLLHEPEEEALIVAMAHFSEEISRAVRDNRPSYVARYLLELARGFNKFYHNCPVLTAEKELREGRLMLVAAVRIVLRNGLALLGIEAPQEM
ncbi:MAG: arginine--tRNA ligase [Bacillota bacterium]